MRDHRTLKAFQRADALVLETYEVTASFPSREMFGLTAQMRRAAVSVASNIVKGCARHSQKEILHFIHVAAGSEGARVSAVRRRAPQAQPAIFRASGGAMRRDRQNPERSARHDPATVAQSSRSEAVSCEL
ncbi:MAG: four helix bundle protein [Steroidobacteraceae bacterium]